MQYRRRASHLLLYHYELLLAQGTLQGINNKVTNLWINLLTRGRNKEQSPGAHRHTDTNSTCFVIRSIITPQVRYDFHYSLFIIHCSLFIGF